MNATIDVETRSCADLAEVGVHHYVDDPTTGIWCLCWCLGNSAVYAWKPGDPPPAPLLDHVEKGGKVVAHNAIFERIVWNAILLSPSRRWPPLRIEQMDCTMARAQVVALPRKLETLATILKTPHQKDLEGARVMKQMMRPRKLHLPDTYLPDLAARALADPVTYTVLDDATIVEWWHTPDRLQTLIAYCKDDVETERDCDHILPHLSVAERELWQLDQRINDRGIHFDLPMVERMIEVRAVASRDLNHRMVELTGGQVRTCSQVKELTGWFNQHGYAVTSLGKEHHEELGKLLNGDALDVLRTRQEFGRVTSTAKLIRIKAVVGEDHRARGQYNHHGASTGRVTGQLLQPTNFPRLDVDRDGPAVGRVLEILQAFDNPVEAHGRIELLVGDVLPWLSKSLRPLITAMPGNKLIGGDLSNIEGRVNAWLAGEAWKVQAFRDQDSGYGADLYKLSYHRSFGMPISEIGFQERQIGKVQELALGYQGSVPAYLGMCKNYNLSRRELAKVAESIYRITPWQEWFKVAGTYDKATTKAGLAQEVWTGLKIIVNRWRGAHPAIVQGWWDAQDAALEAVDQPGTVTNCYHGRVRYLSAEGFLWCQLPSGRVIAYAKPHLQRITEKQTIETLVWNDALQEHEIIFEEVEGRTRIAVAFEGIDGVKKVWRRFHLYGGYQCENIVQATARDIHTVGLRAVEAAGYPVVFHAYDELLAEVPVDYGDNEHFRQLMLRREHWAEGLPLAAKTWEGPRYAK